MKLTARSQKINFQDVAAFSRFLQQRQYTPTRFSLEIPHNEACNAIYGAMHAETTRCGTKLVLDQATRTHIEEAADWLTDPNGKPGLMLIGTVGNGKTTLARALAKLIECVTELERGYRERTVVRFMKSKEICDLRLRADKSKSSQDSYDDLFRDEMIIIDDLGDEPSELQLYGQRLTPVIDLLSARYDKRRSTIITTNLTGEQIEETYGLRILDRLKETMTLIPFTNPSYRPR